MLAHLRVNGALNPEPYFPGMILSCKLHGRHMQHRRLCYLEDLAPKCTASCRLQQPFSFWNVERLNDAQHCNLQQ